MKKDNYIPKHVVPDYERATPGRQDALPIAQKFRGVPIGSRTDNVQ